MKNKKINSISCFLSQLLTQTFKPLLEVSLCRSLVLVAFVFTTAGGIKHSLAQEDTSTGDTESVEKIEITGSHIKRIQVEGPSPIQVIDRKDLEQTGYNSVSDVLRDISASSFGGTREASGSGNPGFASVSLKGLGSNRTLVLLNGKRISIGATDLNLINMAAVERIEILKDGSSAIYGSDALAGVVNIITRRDYQGWYFEAQQSFTELEGGENGHINLVGGHSTDKLSVLGVLGYRDNKTIFDRDRTWTHLKDPNEFSTIGNPGSYRRVIPEGEKKEGEKEIPTPFFPAPDCPQERVVTKGDSQFCSFNYSDFSTGLPALKQLALLLDVNYEYSVGKSVYTRVNYIQRNVNWRYAPPPDVFTMKNPGGLKVSPEESDEIQVRYRLTDLGDRISDVTSNVYGLLVGTSSEFGETWNWVAEANIYEERTADLGISGYARVSALKELIENGEYRPLSADKGDVKKAAHTPESNNIQRVYTAELKASGEIMEMAHGPLSAAIGALGTWEEFTTTVDEVTKAGDLFGGSGAEGDGLRNIQSIYGELLAPLMPNLELQLAGRGDRYSDFGTTFNPKLALRWQALPNLLVRSSAGTGFRAPTTSEINAKESYGFPFFIDRFACELQKKESGGKVSRQQTPACYSAQHLTRSFGNDDLKEEKSLSLNIGTVYQPTDNLSFSLDAWNIRLENSIGVSFGAITEAELAGVDLSKYGISTERSNGGTVLDQLTTPLLNLSETTIYGIDFIGNYKFSFFGNIKAQLGMETSYLLEYNYEPFPNSVVIDALGTNGAPRWRNALSLAFSTDNHILYLVARTVADQEKEVKELGNIPSHTELDLQYKFSTNKYGNFTLGLKNALGTLPPQDDTQTVKVNTSLHSEVGRFGYINYSYSL